MSDKAVYNFGTKNRVPKTNQQTSYATGDDGYYKKGNSDTPRIRDNGNGTATDIVTGLMWIINPQNAGLPWNSNWQTCLTACENLSYAGFTDWRMANINEVLSIVNYASSNPFLISPFVAVDRPIQSSTTLSRSSDWAWSVLPADGETRVLNKTDSAQVFACRLG